MHETKLIFPYFLDQTLRLLFISLLVLYSYYSRAATIRGWLLFEGGYYSRAAFISLESLETSTTAG